MSLAAPTYGVAYSQAEQQANAQTIVDAINTNTDGLAAARQALHDWVNTVQAALVAMNTSHYRSGLFAEAQRAIDDAAVAAGVLIAATS